MNKDITILKELQEISPVVANLTKNNVYITKPDYFNNLAGEILSLIKQNDLFSKAKQNPYITPKGYFPTLAENITQSIVELENLQNDSYKELLEVAPTLNAIDRTNIYAVPENYFSEKLNQLIQKPEAKVVKFINLRKWVTYAAAAVIIGVLGTGVIQYMKVTVPDVKIEKVVANASDEEIDNFLSNEPSTDFAANNATTDEHEATGLFEGTNTDDIKQYLQEQPEMVENLEEGT